MEDRNQILAAGTADFREGVPPSSRSARPSSATRSRVSLDHAQRGVLTRSAPRRAMRFYEYEAKALFARHGAPLLRGRLARTAAEAKAIAAEIGGPVVLKSQVLTGGRMKAGGVKFADTPEQAESAAQAILALEIKGQKPRGVLVEQRAGVAQEYFAAVTWDGRRKLPVLVFSDMGGIDIEEVAETHPEHVAQVHLSTLVPFSPFKAKEAVAAVGVTGAEGLDEETIRLFKVPLSNGTQRPIIQTLWDLIGGMEVGDLATSTNLVFYDREMTGSRIGAWFYLAQGLRVILWKAQVPDRCP